MGMAQRVQRPIFSGQVFYLYMNKVLPHGQAVKLAEQCLKAHSIFTREYTSIDLCILFIIAKFCTSVQVN